MYVLWKGTRLAIGIKIKRPAHLSIVERLGGFWCCKNTNFFFIFGIFTKKELKKEGGSSIKVITSLDRLL